jgi:Tfp pilus assembly protein PilN
MRPVNLLPKDATSRRRGPTVPVPLVAAAALPVVAVAAVGAAWVGPHRQAAERSVELAAVQAQVSSLRAASAGTGAQLASLEASRRSALEDVLAKRLPWDTTMDEIARVLPRGVWLTQVELKSPTPAAVAAPAAPTTTASTTTGTTTTTPTPAPAVSSSPNLSIGGLALTQSQVAETLARLALIPGVANVSLQSSASTAIGKRPAVQFQIAATLGGAG